MKIGNPIPPAAHPSVIATDAIVNRPIITVLDVEPDPEIQDAILDALDPREFGLTFDVISELGENPRNYAQDGSAWLAMTAFPDFLKTAIDKLRARVLERHRSLRHKPSFNLTAACCISLALDVINRHADVHSLISAKSLFDRTDFEYADAEEMAAGFFRNFNSEIVLAGASKKRQNVPLPDETKKQLSALASEIGVTDSSLGVLLIMLTLSTQEVVHADQRERMAKAVSSFLGRVRWRALGAIGLMDVLDRISQEQTKLPKRRGN